MKQLVLGILLTALLSACEKVKYGTEDNVLLTAHQTQCGFSRPDAPITSTVTITSPVRDQYVRSPVLLEGTCQGSTSVTLSGDGLPAPVNVACVGGRFSQSITFSAGEGLKPLIATQTGTPGEFKFCAYVDMTPPAVAILAPAMNATVNGTVNLSGTCEAGLDVRVGGDVSGPTITSCPGGQFSTSVGLDTVSGPRTITVSQTDQAGNTGTAQTTVVRDMSVPLVTIDAPAAMSFVAATFTVSGTCTNGFPVQLAGGGLAAIVSTSCTTGSYSASVTASAGDGNKVVNAIQTNAAGNVGTSTRTFVRDTIAPTVTIAAPASMSFISSTFAINGTCTTGLTVILSGAGLQSPMSTTCNAGTFATSLTATAGDGNKVVIATQTDGAGNSGTDSRTFVRDTTAPSITIAAPAALSFVNATFTISGACTTGLQVNLAGAGVQTPVATACTAGAFSTNITVTAGDGNKVVTAAQTDAAGNVGTDTRTFARDTAGPAIAITAPAAMSFVAATFNINGTCTTGLQVTLDGAGIQTPVNTACTAGAFASNITVTAGDGNKVIRATQTDAAGNVGTDTRTFVRDTVAPAIAITSPAALSFVAATFTVNGTCTAGLQVTLDGAGITAPVNTTCPAGTFAASVTATAGDGNKVVTAAQTDAAGNTGTDTRTFVRDTVAPTIAITAPAALSFVAATFTVNGTCTAGLQVNLTGAGLAAPVNTTCPGGTFTASVTATAGDGNKVVTAAQTDAAGNVGTDTRTFVRDTAAPAIAITAPAALSFVNATFAINGTCTTGLQVNLAGAGLSAPVNTTCPAGTFTANVTVTNGDGDKIVTASQTDAAGNTGTDSRTFVRDTAGPAIAITAPAAMSFVASTFTVNGTCTTGLQVNLAGAGLSAPVNTTCPAGTFTASVTATAGDGNKVVTASQTDAAGNVGTDTRTFVRDTVAPIVAITAPAALSFVTSTFTINGTCTTGIQVNLAGAGLQTPVNTTCPAGTFTASVTVTNGDGDKTVTAAQTDGAGNTGTDSRTFQRDTSAPVVAITSPNAMIYVAASFTVSGTCTTGIQVQLAGAGLQAPVATACTANAFSASVNASAGDGSKVVTAAQTDAAGNTGTDSRTFQRDTTAPVITFTSPAANANISQGFTVTGTCEANLALIFSGNLTAPVNATCSAAGTFSTNLTATATAGVKNVTATQTDMAGNTGTASRAFNLSVAQSAVENFVADASEGKVDILFIDDNSASMEFEQRALGQRFTSFVSELVNLDWQIGITTTDCSTGPFGICGSLLEMVGTGTTILSSAVAGFDQVFRMTIERPETVDCVARGLCPSGLEEALKAANTAMTKRDTNNAGFFRDGAALALVILTDEDEASDAPPTATTPQQVVNQFNSIWGATKKLKSYAITTLPGDTACLATQQAQQGGIGVYGTYAVGLANLTGGRSVSICAPDYSVTLRQIGEDLRTVTSAVKLTRVPIAASVQVTFTPARAITWSVRGDTVLFAQPVPAGTQISVSYQY